MGDERGQPPSKPSAIQIGSAIATSGAVILDVAATGGALTLASGISSVLAAQLDNAEMQELASEVASLEERVDALERSQLRVRRITGNRVKVLISAVEAATNDSRGNVSTESVMGRWGLTPQEFKSAATELDELGLLNAMPGGNSPAGIIRIRLYPLAFLRVAPGMVENVNVGREFVELLGTVRACDGDELAGADEVLEASGLPKPRYRLYVEAAIELGLIDGRGEGNRVYKPYHWLEISERGRRVLRGEDPPPVGDGDFTV